MNEAFYSRPFALIGVVTLTACGAGDFGGGYTTPSIGPGGGEFGATAGGVQDMTFARGIVEQGRVPPPESILVEAIFSEHDLPLNGEECSATFCLRGATGMAPDATNDPSLWVQVGMSSVVNPDTFNRQDLATVFVVDVSGSMGWDYGSENPGQIARSLLVSLANELTTDDQVAMVTYGTDVRTALEFTPGGSVSVNEAIAALPGDGGSTNMEGGLARGYSLAKLMTETYDQVRVILFTDVQPNVGSTSPSQFELMVEDAAADGVSTTILGLGLGLGPKILEAMAHHQGGNAFTVLSPDDVPEFMDDNWPWMASPLAYNLTLDVTAAPNHTLVETHGFPNADSQAAPKLEVDTVFLSKRRGGLLLELKPESGTETAPTEIALSYTSVFGEPITQTIETSLEVSPDARGIGMPQPGIARAVSLAVFTEALKNATSQYPSDPDLAQETLAEAIARLQVDADDFGDTELQTEAEFWPQLLANMEAGATQESFYGGF